jgi:hypothetical protein
MKALELQMKLCSPLLSRVNLAGASNSFKASTESQANNLAAEGVQMLFSAINESSSIEKGQAVFDNHKMQATVLMRQVKFPPNCLMLWMNSTVLRSDGIIKIPSDS